MAPLLRILIQWLPSLPGSIRSTNNFWDTSVKDVIPGFHTNNKQQHIFEEVDNTNGKSHITSTAGLGHPISSVSWGVNRVDAFSLNGNTVVHKFWDGSQWLPSGRDLEKLGVGLDSPPVAVSWGADRLDIFGLDDNNVLKHQYFDGTAWQPKYDELENLGGSCDPEYPIAANTWGPNRLDLFCIGPEGDLLHQYYDGHQWQPEAGALESLGFTKDGLPDTGPSVVSWGLNRLDVFVGDDMGLIHHIYWDGSSWSKWESFECVSQPRLTVNSWGENRIDLFVTSDSPASYEATLRHMYWDGSQWSGWEDMTGRDDDVVIRDVSATSWLPNRIDIVARAFNGELYYKAWNGSNWSPDIKEWYPKSSGLNFYQKPSMVAWGPNRLDIFEVFPFTRTNSVWLHQAWTGNDWYPSSTGWENLAQTQA
ncbi:MAG: hypothetical protein Q9174_004664 [Haloplaca sp. 1 TL-2023]